MNLAVDAAECLVPEVGNPDTPVFDADRITAHVLSPESALVVREGNYTVHYRERDSETVYLVMTTVWQRGPQGWKMVHLHESTPERPGGE